MDSQGETDQYIVRGRKKNSQNLDYWRLFLLLFFFFLFAEIYCPSQGLKQISYLRPVKCIHHINYYRPGVWHPPPRLTPPTHIQSRRMFRLLQGSSIFPGNNISFLLLLLKRSPWMQEQHGCSGYPSYKRQPPGIIAGLCCQLACLIVVLCRCNYSWSQFRSSVQGRHVSAAARTLKKRPICCQRTVTHQHIGYI